MGEGIQYRDQETWSDQVQESRNPGEIGVAVAVSGPGG